MRPAKPRPVSQILTHKGVLRTLSGEVIRQQRLLTHIQTLLSEGPREHCIAAQLKGSSLVLTVDSPVWSSKLRFLSSQILSPLRSTHPGVASIQVKCRPPKSDTMRPKAPVPRRCHSPQAALLLDASASTVTDPKLGAALKRLAATLATKRTTRSDDGQA